MKDATRWMSSAAVGGLLLGVSSVLHAQSAPRVQPVTRVASLAPGSILGIVQDEKGAPVAGATVSALGPTTSVAVTDRSGKFELRTLSPGPYLLRAHLSGFVASRGQVVDVLPSARTSSAIALRHSTTPGTAAPILTAGVDGSADNAPPSDSGAVAGSAGPGGDDHGEIAWRLRHARRDILKGATVPIEMLADDAPDGGGSGPATYVGRAVSSPARLASNFFAGTPFSGQVNLLTTGSFDTPQQLFSSDNFSRSIAYLAVGAPVGEHADWTVRAALTQGDIASWFVAGEYTTRAPAEHRYDIGMSYSTQRYDGGNFAALRDVTDGSRNAGAIYGFDTYSITPRLTLAYGGRFARYDYLATPAVVSPRAALTIEPADHVRVSAMVARRALAPGAEEFMPRADSGVWLPPQRTFASLLKGRPLEAERTNHAEIEVERDLGPTTLSARAFRQHVADQLVTLFGLDMPGTPAAVGHYFLASAGDLEASGVSAGVRTEIAGRVRGSLAYSVTRGLFIPADEASFLLLFAPSAARTDADRIHDLSTAIETDVPETSTHVVVLYRVSNGFARSQVRSAQPRAATPASVAVERAGLDSRFDVQVRQSLPFMDFNSTKWEMLLGVRNFFHETAADQSVYDELLVVRPPKRIVGGLTLKF